jgi:hypothetical protein
MEVPINYGYVHALLFADILDTFGSQRLQLGGPVHMETLTLLHAFAGLSGAQKVSEVSWVYELWLPQLVPAQMQPSVHELSHKLCVCGVGGADHF